MNSNKIIMIKEILIISSIILFISPIFAEENFNVKEGVTTKKEVDNKWGAPAFIRNIIAYYKRDIFIGKEIKDLQNRRNRVDLYG